MSNNGKEYEVEIESIDPGRLPAVWLFKIHGPKDSFFTYRIAFSAKALATVRGGIPLIDDPVEDGLRETKRLISLGFHRDLRIVRRTRGYDKPQSPKKPLKKHSAYYS